MTPQQKLVRLKEMLDLADHDGIEQLLADVHLPPPELANLPNDPGAWAKHMAATVAGLSEETAFAWLGAAMHASAEWGHRNGRLDGRAEARQEEHARQQGALDALTVVLLLIDRRQIRPPLVRDGTDPDNPPITLREYLAGVLRAAGVEVDQ
jgi:hypothetical protein